MTRISQVLLATGAVVISCGLVAASAAADHAARGDLQAAAVAMPSEAAPNDHTRRFSVDATRATSVEVTGSATTSLTCDVCRGQALSLQVVYADRASSLAVRNVAAAWAGDCEDCSGWAVSLQVVIAASPASVQAGNRAVALNAGCVNCHTSAVALQYVVLGASGRELSAAALRRIVALRAQLLAALPSAASKTLPVQRPRSVRPDAVPAARRAISSTVARIQDVLATDLHAAPVRSDVKITTG